MTVKEQNIVMHDTDAAGNKVMQFPLAHAGWIEGLSRTPETAYAAGDLVICPYHTEFMLKCTTAGTTSADKTIDTTNATKSATIKDGTVTWTVIAKAIIDASISGKTITVTFADGTTKTLTTQDTTNHYRPNWNGVVTCTRPSTSELSYTVPSDGYMNIQLYSDGSYIKVNDIEISQHSSYGGARLADTHIFFPVTKGDVVKYLTAAGQSGDGYYTAFCKFIPAKTVS